MKSYSITAFAPHRISKFHLLKNHEEWIIVPSNVDIRNTSYNDSMDYKCFKNSLKDEKKLRDNK